MLYATGLGIFDLETGGRTRVYAGHSSPVVSLSPSRDGRWLASSSLDQTVLLYPLDGCDTRPPLGSGFRLRPEGTYAVESVERQSFAAAMGLLPADVLVQVGGGWGEDQNKYHNTAAELDEFFRTVPQLQPSLYTIGIKVRRTLTIPTIGAVPFEAVLPTTRRNNPALALFVGTDREWVLWTPQGYYDTSIGGTRVPGLAYQRRLPLDPAHRLRPDRDLCRDDVTAPGARSALADGRPRSALEQAERPAGTVQPEPGRMRAPAPHPLHVGGVRRAAARPGRRVDRPDRNPRVGLSIQAEADSKIGCRRVIFDEQVLGLSPLAGPQPGIAENVQVELVPRRRVRLAVEAANEDGTRRTEVIDMVYIPEEETPAAPAAAGRARPRGRSIAESRPPAARRLRRPRCPRPGRLPLRSPDLTRRSEDGSGSPEDRRVLTGECALAGALGRELEELREWVRSKRLRKGDIVAVVIAAHILELDGTPAIAAADSDPHGGVPAVGRPAASVPAGPRGGGVGPLPRGYLPGPGMPEAPGRLQWEDLDLWARPVGRSVPGPPGVGVRFDAASRCWLVSDQQGDLIKRSPANELTQERIMALAVSRRR